MERIDRIEKAIEELVAAQKVTDEQLAKTDVQLAKTDVQLAKTDVLLAELIEQQKLTDAQIKETNRQLGGIGNSNGEFAENFFYSSLQQKMELGGIKFDHIEKNVKGRFRNLTDEFDIVLYNGDSVGILEVKNNVKSSNIKQLMTTKLQNFKTLNPGYADAKIYLGIAGFTFDNADVKKEAKAAGFVILEVQGDHHEADTTSMKAY